MPAHSWRRPGTPTVSSSTSTIESAGTSARCAAAAIAAEDDVVRLSVSGLSDDEVGEFVKRTTGDAAGPAMPEIARAISDLAGGNPFLVCELWRVLIETNVIEIVDGTARLTSPLTALGTPER